MPPNLSKRVEALAGKRKEEVFVLMPPSLCSNNPDKNLLNVSTGKFHKAEDLQKVGGKLIDCFPNTK